MSWLRLAWAGAARAAGPALPLWLAARARTGKEFPARLAERRGIAALPRPQGQLLWLHGASVGETQSLLPLLSRLHGARPDLSVLVTSGTATSARLLARRLGGAEAAADQSGALPEAPWARHQFLPLDHPGWVARFLDHWRPDLALFVESELWPNLLSAVAVRRIPAALLNARMSARSAARWARAPGLARALLGGFAVVLAQSEADRARLAALGARAEMQGNLKWAAPPLPAEPAELARLQALLGARPRWAMASTHPGDEALAAAAHQALAADHPGLVTMIVPRHPERGPAIAAELAAQTPARRAAGADPTGGIWIADTLGELGLIYRLAPIVVMGKSFAPPGGGQNPLEPARLGCATGFGPRMENFLDPARALAGAGAAVQLRDAAALPPHLRRMLNDPAEVARMGARAAQVAADEAGVLDRVLERLGPLLPPPATTNGG